MPGGNLRSLPAVRFAVVMAAFAVRTVAAQAASRDAALARNGPVAGIAWSALSVSFDGARSDRTNGVGLYFGAKLTPPPWICDSSATAACRMLRRLQLTPHVAIAATHLRGLDVSSGGYAFSYVDKLGIKAAYPIRPRFRATFIWRSGNRTAELIESNDVVNYWGAGTTLGGGFEIPITPQGRGIELALVRTTGRFDQREVRNLTRNEKEVLAADLPFRAVILQVGWSGPFTGISLPWQ